MKKIDFRRSILESGLEWRAVTKIIMDVDQMGECIASEEEYTTVCHSKVLHGPVVLTFRNSTFCPHTLHVCILYGSQSKQRLFPCTALAGWLL
jgi:hypothetical protein